MNLLVYSDSGFNETYADVFSKLKTVKGLDLYEAYTRNDVVELCNKYNIYISLIITELPAHKECDNIIKRSIHTLDRRNCHVVLQCQSGINYIQPLIAIFEFDDVTPPGTVALYFTGFYCLDNLYDAITDSLTLAVKKLNLDDVINFNILNRPIFEQVKKFISANLSSKLTRKSIGEALYMNPDYVAKKFKEETGLSLFEYVKQVRLNTVKKLLIHTDCSIANISKQVGFKDQTYVSTSFKSENGCSPSIFRKKYKNK